MSIVRLELNKIEIHRPKQRWRLYFVIVADHPENKDQMVVTVIPEDVILVVPDQENIISFEPEGKGSDGMLLLSRELPSNRELNVHFYVMHSRRSKREVGEVLNNIKSGVGNKVIGLATDILGTATPWLAISKTAISLIGQVLEKIPDRSLGFVSMFERFGSEFENEVEIDRENRGGNVTVVHSWSLIFDTIA